jgi:hypothetical protein
MAFPCAARAAVCAFLMLQSLAAGAPAQSELVIAREGDTLYHRPGCATIRDGKNVVALTRAQATARGLVPHEACHAEPSETRDADRGRPQPQPDVYVDGGRYYHRKDCGKLGAEAKKLELEGAAKKYWPCPACKPPIRKRKPL